MRIRPIVSAALGSLLMSGVAHARATFDPTTASIQLPADGELLFRYDFEGPDALGDLVLVRGQGSAYRTVPLDETMLTSGPDDAVEGEHALRVSGSDCLFIPMRKVAAHIASRRIEISFWAREDGGLVNASLLYDYTSLATSVPTGRRTSDGWAEFVIGPIDAQAWGKAPSRIGLRAMKDAFSPASKQASIVLDAVEVRTVDGAPTDPKACTQANVASVCGPAGACAYGHCVSSDFESGPLPNKAQRQAFVERWIFFATSVLGDRKAAAMAQAEFAPKARNLADSAVSSTEFYGGLQELLNRLRDAHTSFPTAYAGVDLTALTQSRSSAILGACFGLLDKDLLGGGLAYGVFATVEDPMTGVHLKKGDVLTAIDGQAPKAWVDTYWPRFAGPLPNDPAADWGVSALDLAGLVSTRASTLTFTRCTSPTTCTGNSREDFTVDIGAAAYKAVVQGKAWHDDNNTFPGTVACSPRFIDAVAHPGGPSTETVHVAQDDAGPTRIQFDGVGASASWLQAFTDAFASRPSHALIDARLGLGGSARSAQGLLTLLRDKDDPIVLLAGGRRGYDVLDLPWGMDKISQCDAAADNDPLSYDCLVLRTTRPSTTNPPGAGSRIAWVNTVDVSANDILPRLLKGRKDFKIFAPHPTEGAYGAILRLPPLTPAFFTGGSIQVLDSKVGVDVASALASTWESGVGVAPDITVTQKLSDALAGRDTLLEAANAWLVTP